MSNNFVESRNALVDSARLAADFYGPYLVGHTLPSSRIPDGYERVMYAREGIALGKGSFGQIYPEHAQNECPGAPWVRAIKEVKKEFVLQHNLDWKREVEALMILGQSEGKNYFVTFHGWYENAETLFLAMEYFPLGDLSRFIKDVTTEEDVKSIASQVVAGLDVMHRHQMVHRDLNPRNILVAAHKPHWVLKLADFGSSKRIHETTRLNTTTGTLGYMAPEYSAFMRNHSEYAPPTSAVDLWSAGCIFYELYTKDRPFSEQQGPRALERYCSDPVLPEALGKSFASSMAKDALHRFLEPNPMERITAEEAVMMHWLVEESENSSTGPIDTIDEGMKQIKIDPADDEGFEKYPAPSFGTLPNNSTISLATTATLVNPVDEFSGSKMSGVASPSPLRPPAFNETNQSFPPPPTPLRPGTLSPQSTATSFRGPSPRAFVASPLSKSPMSPQWPSMSPSNAESPEMPPRRQSEASSSHSIPLTDYSSYSNQMPPLSRSITAPNPPLPPRRQSSATTTHSLPTMSHSQQLNSQTYFPPPSVEEKPSLPPRRQSSTQSYASNSSALPTQIDPKYVPQPPPSYSSAAPEEYPALQSDLPEYKQPKPDQYETAFESPDLQRQKESTCQPIHPWLTCSYNFQELRMSLGPVAHQQDPLSNCEMCDERIRMVGPRSNGSLQAMVYLCETCGKGRLLCERCARETANRPGDPHEADHMLRRVGPAHSFSFEQFVQSCDLSLEMRENMPPNYGSVWLQSDHGFEAPAKAGANCLRAHVSLDAPPGVHNVAVHIRIAFDPAKITSDAMGVVRKKRMQLSKEPFGYLAVGAETSLSVVDDREKLYDRYMPSNTIMQPVLYTSGQTDYNMTFKLKMPLQVQAGQRIIVTVKSSHETGAFPAGCPFKWHLNFVGLSQFGQRSQLATKGQLTRREQVIATQKEVERHKKIDRNIGYVKNVLQVSTMGYGLYGAAVDLSSRRAKKQEHQWGAMNNYASAVNHAVHARNGMMGSTAGSEYGHEGYGYDYNGYDAASLAGGGVADATQQWVSDQAAEPFVASFESVEYTVGQDGSASASYLHYGVG